MSEKKNSLEEKRILQKKLQWYTLEAEDGEFNATEVEAMLERLDELESLPEKEDRKSTRLNSSHRSQSRMPSSA